MRLPTLAIALTVAATAPWTPRGSLAQPPAAASAQSLRDAAGFRGPVTRLIKAHCISCHGPEVQQGKLRLDTLVPDFGDAQAAALWVEVMNNLNLGEMPPADEPAPPVELTAAVANWIADELRHARIMSQSTGGRVLLRRLSRSEYANAVRDLLAVEFLPKEGPVDLLPPDGRINGFDKVSKALLLDPSLMEQYFEVASLVADKAVVTGPPPVPTRVNRMEYEEIQGGIEYIKHDRSTIVTDDGIITMSKGMRSDENLRHAWDDSLIPTRGKYRLRLRVGADPQERDALYIRVTRGGDGDIYFGKVPGTLDKPQVIEVVRAFDTPGSGEIGVRLETATDFSRVNYHYSDLRRQSEEAITKGEAKLAGRLRAQFGAQGFPNQARPHPETRTTDHLPRVFFDWIELEGPLYDQWPPRSTEKIFHLGLDDQRFGAEYARQIFSRLLPRAFRRRVTRQEVDAVVDLVMDEVSQGAPFPEAVKAGLVATLCSPSFLLVYEPVQPGEQGPRPLNPFELATRMSLLLWSSIPDDELYRAAAAGKLDSPQQLLAQTRRMLADPRSEALVDGFARQWLKADEFDRFAVDRNLYREFYQVENAGLNEAINAEPIEFFRHLLTNDGDVRNFLSCDWTMANEVLARHYGVKEIEGSEFRRVTLPPDLHRGGLVTMAAVHKWGSDGNRTKPVERAKYVLEVLFNDPPTPPPPNVGEVEPNIKGTNLTVRQRLNQHRTIAACAHCHRTLDPYGLALENFNVVSRWRTKQDGEQGHWPDTALIDPSGVLPNGVEYASFDEYRAALAAQDQRFLKAIAEKMYTYALGRVVEPADHDRVEALVIHMQAQGHSLRSLLEGIVLSDAFRTK